MEKDLIINHSLLSFRSWGYKLKIIVMKPFAKKLAALIILASYDQS